MSLATPTYVLDANVFIDGHRRYYAFAICPGFWEAIVQHHQTARVISIDRVHNEFHDGDELKDWVKNSAPASLWASTADAKVVSNFGDIAKWVQAQPQFKPEAIAEFMDAADGWLVAYAMAHDKHIVVTHEEHAPDAKKRVPLPNVCKQFGVEYTDTFIMLKELKARFDLAKS